LVDIGATDRWFGGESRSFADRAALDAPDEGILRASPGDDGGSVTPASPVEPVSRGDRFRGKAVA
jgi:hypothetical protein